MAVFFEYLRNITYYLFFAALAVMAAPAGKYSGYIKLVTGLVLLLLILQPLKAFVDGVGVPVTMWRISVPEMDYSNLHSSSLQDAFEEQLNIQLTELLRQNDYELLRAGFEYSGDFSRIESMDLIVSANKPGSARRPFIRIEPVIIGGGTSQAESREETAIKKLIAAFYSLPVEHIHVEIRNLRSDE
jgi:hypothetical protein